MRLSTPSAVYSLVSRALPRFSATRTSSRPLSSLSLYNRNTNNLNHTLRQRTRVNRPLTTTRSVQSEDDGSIDKRPLTDRPSDATTDAQNAEQNRLRREQEPAYQIVFTCKPCGHRSAHRMSKHGYHRGTVVIRCPSCANRHVMSDHLKIFFDQNSTLEDILHQTGGKVTRGYLEGDMEFWEDGSVTKSAGSEASAGKSGQGEATAKDEQEQEQKKLS
ncbi:DNL zinc finger [Aspergillus sp. HF37]|nr:DNL zinc finger [Aspergillus sp. HF37]